MHHICNKFQEVSFIQQIFKISRMFSASFYIFSDFSAFMEIQSFLLYSGTLPFFPFIIYFFKSSFSVLFPQISAFMQCFSFRQ